MKKLNAGRKIKSIADLSELLGGRENLDAIVRQRLGVGLDEVEGPSVAPPWGQKPYRWRGGRTPIRTTLVEARINYYDGREEDRVRLQILTDGTWQISGWPHAPVGVKRPREKSFPLSDVDASSFEFQLGRLSGLVPGKGHRSNEECGEMREAVKIVLHGTSCDGRYSWNNGAPGKWRKLEDIVMALVFRFNELCRGEGRAQ